MYEQLLQFLHQQVTWEKHNKTKIVKIKHSAETVYNRNASWSGTIQTPVNGIELDFYMQPLRVIKSLMFNFLDIFMDPTRPSSTRFLP